MTSTRDDGIRDSAPERPAPAGVLVGLGGDPLIVGLIFFAIAAVALGMALIGMPTASRTPRAPRSSSSSHGRACSCSLSSPA